MWAYVRCIYIYYVTCDIYIYYVIYDIFWYKWCIYVPLDGMGYPTFRPKKVHHGDTQMIPGLLSGVRCCIHHTATWSSWWLAWGPKPPQKKNMVSLFQWEFQDSKLEIPTIYKTYIRAKFQGIPIDCFPVQNNQASTKDDNVGSLLCLRNQAVAMRYDKPKTYPLVLSK